MQRLRILPTIRHRPVFAAPLGMGLLGLACLLLAACGTSSTTGATSGAAATPTCPSAPTLTVVNGTISAVSGGSLTVTGTNGATSTVHLAANVTIRKLTTLPISSLTAGTRVQVVTDTDVTTAQRIVLTTAGQGTGGGFGGGAGGGGVTRTPGANSSCFSRRGQGTPGSGIPGQNTFRGIRGTVDTATSTKLTMEDAQGQVYNLAITPTTLIQTTTTGQPSDLTVGSQVQATGTKAADGSVTARTITVSPPAGA
jgi:hypothetical protein